MVSLLVPWRARPSEPEVGQPPRKGLIRQPARLVPSQPALSDAVASVTQRYERAGLWVAIFVTFGWHLAGVLPVVVASWSSYGFVASSAVTWLVYTALGVATVRVVLRGGGHGPALPLAVCPILLAGAVVGSLLAPAPEGVIGHFNWPFTQAGWFAVLALWRRPLAELIGFYAANVLSSGVIMAVMGQASRVNVGRFIALCCAISALQMTVFVGTRIVTAMARRGAEAEDELATTRSAHIAAEAVQAARRVRYEMINRTVAHLLDDLAKGQLDLAQRSVRQQVAVAVTRLRRYLVESDEVPDRLMHEIAACTDAAERRGIAVDQVAPVGQVPPLPVDVRRALTEPIIAALAGTATKARLTVVASPDEVVVAIVADARLDSAVPSLHEAVESSHDAEGELLWVQARWARPSASLS